MEPYAVYAFVSANVAPFDIGYVRGFVSFYEVDIGVAVCYCQIVSAGIVGEC